MNLTLRPMTLDDQPDALAIARTLSNWFQTLDQMTLAMDVKQHIGRVAVNDWGQIVGFLTYRMKLYEEQAAELTWLAVHADLRSQGIGSFMLGELELELIDKGIISLELSTVPGDHEDIFIPTNNFYLERGYTEQRRENHFYALGRPRVVLKKVFDASTKDFERR